MVLLTGAIVALAFTAVGGDPTEDSVESRFRTVGSSIAGPDPSSFSNEFSTIPLEDEEPLADGLFDALPTDADLEQLVDITRARVLLQVEETIDPGPARAYCTGEVATALDGARRTWSAAGGSVEVEVSVIETADADEAAAAVESRLTDEFLACIPEAVTPSILSGTTDGYVLDDTATVDAGDQLEQIVLTDRGSNGAVYAWRQVDQYVVSIKVFDFDADEGADLAVTSVDDVLDLVTEALKD